MDKGHISTSDKRHWIVLVLGASAILGASYALEHGLSLKPCPLCLKQRVLWWVLWGLGLCALPEKFLGIRVYLRWAAVAVMLASLALALYHAGGERELWHLTWFCEGFDFDADISPEALAALLAEREGVACDTPALVLFSLSLAEYNALASLGMLALLWRMGRGRGRGRGMGRGREGERG